MRHHHKHKVWRIFFIIFILLTIVYVILGVTKVIPWNPVDWFGKHSGKNVKCNSNTDCTNPNYPICIQGQCIAVKCGDGCEKDSDCMRTQNCFSCYGGKCVPTSQKCGTCKVNTDCKNKECSYCLNGTCTPYGCGVACEKSTDCTFQQCPYCVNGKCNDSGCQMDCKSSTDCKDSNCPECTQDVCVPKAPTCPQNPLPTKKGPYTLYTEATGPNKVLSYSPQAGFSFQPPNTEGFLQYIHFNYYETVYQLEFTDATGEFPVYLGIDDTGKITVTSGPPPHLFGNDCGMIFTRGNHDDPKGPPEYMLLSTVSGGLIATKYVEDGWKNQNAVWKTGAPPPPLPCTNWSVPEQPNYYKIYLKNIGEDYPLVFENSLSDDYIAFNKTDTSFDNPVFQLVNVPNQPADVFAIKNHGNALQCEYDVYATRDKSDNTLNLELNVTGGPSWCKTAYPPYDYTKDSTAWWVYDKTGLLTDPDKKVMMGFTSKYLPGGCDENCLASLKGYDYNQYGCSNDKFVVEFDKQ